MEVDLDAICRNPSPVDFDDRVCLAREMLTFGGRR